MASADSNSSSCSNKIVDCICKVLRYDVRDLFAKESNSSDSEMITHKYSSRLRVSGERPSQNKMDDTPNGHDQDTGTPRSIGVHKKMMSLFAKAANILGDLYNTYGFTSWNTHNNIEERAQILWGTLRDATMKDDARSWNELDEPRKLIFYWAAVSDEILSEDPFQNFKRFYCTLFPRNKGCGNNYKQELLITWHELPKSKKMPFVVEAFIAKMSAGKVRIRCERDIQAVMRRLQSKCN